MNPLIPLLSLTTALLTAHHSAQAGNLLRQATPATWQPGGTLPSPWQHSDRESNITVEIIQHQGTHWVHLVDNSPHHSANIRQAFDPISAGRLTLRILPRSGHQSEIGIYLGHGNASSPEERTVDLKTNPQGHLRIGSGGARIDSGLTLVPGQEEHLFIDFQPAANSQDLSIRVGRILANGREVTLGEHNAQGRATPVTRLRITTDNTPVGADFLITDIQLTPLP